MSMMIMIRIKKMRKIVFYAFLLLCSAGIWSACQKGNNYPGGEISPVIPILDVKSLYKGADVTLDIKNMAGSHQISGIVISDFSGGNMPAGMLILQDHRRLSKYQGIAVAIGPDASKYTSGDSVTVEVTGGVLKRANGTLQITNVPANAVTKLAGGRAVGLTQVTSTALLANPTLYESTMVTIVKGSFDPLPTPTDKFSGDKTLTDGYDNVTLHTDAAATFANNSLPNNANYYVIAFVASGDKGSLVPQLRARTDADVKVLGSTIASAVVSGFINDVIGGDGNYEYIQLLATRDIDFAATPLSVVVCNNAGASTPLGFPANGWATGGGSITPVTNFKTFKFNLTTGTAKKGTFFYVGGAGKTINGSSSTSMASSNWVRAFNYTTQDGDGFGIRSGGIFANSGNAFGMAVFNGTDVTKDSEPIDVIFVSTGGSLYSAGPPVAGYKITNTDFYDTVNPTTFQSQPYYRQGSNTSALSYTTPADAGFFYKLGGVYNSRIGKWLQARSQQTVILTKTSTLGEIEGEFPVGSGIVPTALKD